MGYEKRKNDWIFPSAGGATDVDFGPDGRLLASAGHPDLMVHLWDIDTGAEVRTIQGPGTESYAASIEFSPNGNTLAVGYWDAVQLWDINNWTEIGYFRNPTNGIIFGLEFAPDESYLMVFVPYENKMLILDSGLKLIATMEYIGNVAFSPDGTLVAANDSGLKLFDSSTWEVRDSLPLPLGPVQQMVFRPGKPVLVSIHEGGITVARDLRTGAEISRISNPGKHFLSSDGKLLAVGAESGEVSVWDVETGNLLKSYQQDSTWGVSEITFSQDNRLLTIYYPDNVASKVVFWEWETDQEPGVFLLDDAHAYIGTLAHDGSRLAVWIWKNDIPANVGVWDTQTRDLVWTSKRSDASWISSVALDPNGEFLAVGDRWIGTVSLYDANSGTLLKTLNEPDRLPDHDIPVNDIIFSNNGKFMVTIINGGPVIWDLEKYKVIHVERGCIRAIESIVFSQDDTLFMITGDKNLYTGTGGGGVCIWETQTGKLLASSGREDAYPSKFATFNRERTMLAVDDNGTIWLWGIFQ